MLFTTLLSTVSVLAAGAHAGTIKRQDPHIVDFRTWGQSACSEDNQGIWTFTASQLTGCKSFSSFGGGNVQSLSLVDIAEGCSCVYSPLERGLLN
jgi:hypothetical protein